MFTIRRSRGRQRGQSTIEYAALVGTIVVILIGAVATLGPTVSNVITDTVGQVAGITGDSNGGGGGGGGLFNAGPATKLLILFPGEEQAPGTETGKTGAPTQAVLGAEVIVTIKAVDNNWDTVTTETSSDISIAGWGETGTSSSGYMLAPLVAGVGSDTITFGPNPGAYFIMAYNNDFTLANSSQNRILVGPEGWTQIELSADTTGTEYDSLLDQVHYSVKFVATGGIAPFVWTISDANGSFTDPDVTYTGVFDCASERNGDAIVSPITANLTDSSTAGEAIFVPDIPWFCGSPSMSLSVEVNGSPTYIPDDNGGSVEASFTVSVNGNSGAVTTYWRSAVTWNTFSSSSASFTELVSVSCELADGNYRFYATSAGGDVISNGVTLSLGYACPIPVLAISSMTFDPVTDGVLSGHLVLDASDRWESDTFLVDANDGNGAQITGTETPNQIGVYDFTIACDALPVMQFVVNLSNSSPSQGVRQAAPLDIRDSIPGFCP